MPFLKTREMQRLDIALASWIVNERKLYRKINLLMKT